MSGSSQSEKSSTSSSANPAPMAPGLQPTEKQALSGFFDNDIIGVLWGHCDGHFLEVNDYIVKLLGYSKEDMESGKVRWADITPPEYKHLDEGAIEQLKKTGRIVPFEKEYIHKDGHRVPVLLALIACNSKWDEAFFLVLNLSDRKRIERALKESEAHFRLMAEAMPQIVWIVEPEGVPVYLNDRFYEVTGCSRDVTGAEMWVEVVHPDDFEYASGEWLKCVEAGVPVEMECRYRVADGSYRWQLIRGLPLRDDSGAIFRWLGTSTDIDDQKRAQEVLKESELYFRTLADAIPQIVWTADALGHIDFFNHRWFEYTGLTLEQSLEDGWQLLIHPEDRPKYLSEWKKALASGDSYEMEFRLQRVLGLGKKKHSQTYRWHLCRAIALRSSHGNIIKWFATWTEIDDQKAK